MKSLAEYLAECIVYESYEVCSWRGNPNDIPTLKRLIEQGIKMYQSTENCDIVIAYGDCPECNTPMTKGIDTMFSLAGDKMEVGVYICAECGYELQY